MLILGSIKKVGRSYLFGVAAFPLIAAYGNGKSISYLANLNWENCAKSNESTIKIPILGKKRIKMVEFLTGVTSEAVFILFLLPLRGHILRIFFEDLEVGEKWPTYVLVACICSFVIIGGAAAVKLVIRSIGEARAEFVHEEELVKREEGTISNLTSKKEISGKKDK